MGDAGEGDGTIRVYILDDHELVRLGLKDVLEDEGMEVVGESASAAEASRRIPALRPYVAVLDGRLGDGTGIEVCRTVRSVDPRIRCLILAAHEDGRDKRAAFQAGASAYLLKQIGNSDLAALVRRVAAGEVLLGPEEEQGAPSGAKDQAPHRRLEGLTPQEARVLELIGQDLSNRQIARELFLAGEDREELHLIPPGQARPRTPNRE